MVEHLEGKIQVVAEGLQMLDAKVDRNHAEVSAALTGVDRRLTRIEARVFSPPAGR